MSIPPAWNMPNVLNFQPWLVNLWQSCTNTPPVHADQVLSNSMELVPMMIPDFLLYSGHRVSQAVAGDNLGPSWRHTPIGSQQSLSKQEGQSHADLLWE